MKVAPILSATILLAFSANAGAQTAAAHADHGGAHGPSWGVHGMVLFGGRDGLYASHLPLFRPPHDRQLILELALDDAAADQALRAALAREPGQLWTIEPEHFELARLFTNAADPLRTFTATVYHGHFERGGTPERHDVRFRIARVLIDRPLDGAPRTLATAPYERIGQGDATFMVKRLDARPDFDHILRIPPAACPARITLKREGLQAPPAKAWLGRGRCRAVGPTIYFETDDLR